MMFGGEGSGVPLGQHGRRSAIPPVNWRATVNGFYGTRVPRSRSTSEKGNILSVPGVSPQAFDLVGITNTVGAPFLRVFCEGWESEMPPPRQGSRLRNKIK